MEPKRKRVYVVCGPTASGKTAMALQLALHLGTEIVSADSRQCYKGMAIGTAQPTAEELAAVRHHFVAAYEVDTTITAADYETIALGHLANILAQHDAAVVVGGTGLYIKALCDGLDEMPEIDEAVASNVAAGYAAHGLGWLQTELERVDAAFYAVCEQQNPARLIRGLVFRLSTGRSILDYRTGVKKVRDFDVVKVAPMMERGVLYERINQRVDAMVAQGLVEEVQQLLAYRQHKNMQTVGYSEVLQHLDGVWTLDYAIDKIKQHSRNYAKRQLTWFAKDERVQWVHPNEPGLMNKIVSMKGE